MGGIYALAREAFAGGQRAFQFQAFPFRMTAENIVKHGRHLGGRLHARQLRRDLNPRARAFRDLSYQ